MGQEHPTALSAARLAIAIGDAAPTEFRVFGPGWNETENGRYLFDAEAASAVMAAYGAHAVDRMIDLEHLSIDPSAPHYDPDARGWAQLELRADGSLWAVGVRWTPDGAARLSEKRQRYISPAFTFDAKTRRVAKVVNIAITSLPATHGTEALVAASMRAQLALPVDPSASPAATTEPTGASSMGAKEIAKACADCMAACEVCAKAIDSGDIDATVKAATACAAACDACETACGALTGAPPEPADEAPPVDPATNAGVPPVAPPPAAMAANSALMRLSCKATVDEALAEIATWRTSHLALEADRAKLATERGALENVARRDLVVQLVKLGAETPATSGMNVGTLCARLAGEPLAELRDRVVQLAARPPIKQLTPETESGLTPREVEMCRVKKIDPAQYAANRSAIRARSQSAKQES